MSDDVRLGDRVEILTPGDTDMAGERLTDEEFGRAWATQMGRVPYRTLPPVQGVRGSWVWFSPHGDGPEIAPNAVLPVELSGVCGYPGYRIEADAYCHLGRAVRTVITAVPPLAGPIPEPEGGT